MQGKENVRKGCQLFFSESHICGTALSSWLIMGNTSTILLTRWVRNNSFYFVVFLEYIMLQMISMKKRVASAFQQKTWVLAPGEWQNSTWLLMLPLAGSGSGSSWELLCFVPIQPDAEVGGFWVVFQLGKQKCRSEMVLGWKAWVGSKL